jgi:chromosomal replication initiation ATPase DnaA
VVGELKAQSFDLQHIATPAAEIFQIERDEIFSPRRQSLIVCARRLVCFWAVRELGLSLSELARTLSMTAFGRGYTIVRRKKRENYEGNEFKFS